MQLKWCTIVTLVLILFGLIAVLAWRPWSKRHRSPWSMPSEGLESRRFVSPTETQDQAKTTTTTTTSSTTKSPTSRRSSGSIIFEDITVKRAHTDDHCDAGICNRRSGAGMLDSRIIGGSVATAHEFPWMAQIKDTQGSHICGGALLNRRYILTAAHCVDACSVASRLCYAKLGVHNSTNPPPAWKSKFEIESMHARRDYGLFSEDVAVLRLQRDVEFSKQIMPICLPSPIEIGEVSAYQGRITVAGWGLTSNGVPSPLLRKLSATDLLSSHQDSKSKYAKRKHSGCRSFLCLKGVDGARFESGDSGGPAWIYEARTGVPEVIGVVSHYRLNVMRLSRVPLNVDWILKMMNC